MEIQLWKKILTPYELAVQEILVKFNHIIMEYRSADMYSPIETVNGRVKSISSILEKCRKKKECNNKENNNQQDEKSNEKCCSRCSAKHENET